MKNTISILVFLVNVSCAHVVPLRNASDSSEAQTAQQEFFSAKTLNEMIVALSRIEQAAPNGWRYHEAAAVLSQLRAEEDEAIEHFILAASDVNDIAVKLHIHTLMAMRLTDAQQIEMKSLLAALSQAHQEIEVRVLAAHSLASMNSNDGELDERSKNMQLVTGQIPLAIVGTWENDQGKGFELEYAPEASRGLKERYDGRWGQLTWKENIPRTPLGHYDFVQVFKATSSTVAYAQGVFSTTGNGNTALMLNTGDATKVWVDNILVFSASRISREIFGNIVIPLKLAPGPHQLFIKSADTDGDWILSVRIAQWNLPVPVQTAPFDVEHSLSIHSPDVTSARGQWERNQWAHLAFGGLCTVKQAEFFESKNSGVLSKLALADAYWFNQDRGRAADVLYALDEKVGAQLPLIRLRTLRLQLQEGRKQKAREGTLEFLSKHQVREGFELLAEIWRGEGWTQNELNALRDLKKYFEPRVQNRLDEAAAVNRLGHEEKAIEMYRSILNSHPTLSTPLRRLGEMYAENNGHSQAQQFFQKRIEAWPTAVYTRMALAGSQREAGEFDKALESLKAAAQICEECASLESRMGDIEYERGNTPSALEHWKRSLLLTPDQNDLANRVEFLAPEARGPHMDDAPTEREIEALVQRAKLLKPISGADLIWLLDDEVTLLNNDGSTSNLVTMVVHALNPQGRDKIIKQSVGFGRLRVLHSYVVDENGKRVEAQAERDRQIFFRGMLPRSTLVLQYKIERPRSGFLSGYFNSTWSFQGPREARENSHFVLWTPLGTKLHEARVGELTSSVNQRGNHLRFEWGAKNMLPVPLEPRSPTPNELGTNIKLSSIPDWNTWLKWEEALLEGAFRDSDELKKVVSTLNLGNPDANEKLKRIHTFVMEEIRYQQDYESFIAGVKPHAAPVTLERKYGDCKDKAVLFIQLAKNMNLDAHFALVRTRDVGPVDQNVPMQQFNHAIVYVPEQPGVIARFFDPTAELLDVESVRSDDVGTSSLVYDTKNRKHTWRKIEFQAPELNRDETTVRVALDAKGDATGTMILESVGRGGSSLRRLSKNAEGFTQFMQRMGSAFLSDSTVSDSKVIETENLRVPARVEAHVTSNSMVKRDGDVWRIKIPTDANPKTYFSLQTRKTPLLLGTPSQSVVLLDVTIPAEMKLKQLPQMPDVELPCLTLKRESQVTDNHISLTTTYTSKCERLSVEEYPIYREKLDDMMKLLEDELVLERAIPSVKNKTTKSLKVAPK